MTGSFARNFYDCNFLKDAFTSKHKVIVVLTLFSQCKPLSVKRITAILIIICIWVASVKGVGFEDCDKALEGVGVRGYGVLPSRFWAMVLP